MTTFVPTELSELLSAADAHEGVDDAALFLTIQAVLAAAQVSPQLARPHVGRLWFTPWRVPGGAAADEREARWTEGMTHSTFDVGGESLHALELGDGPTVMLLHGWGDYGARVSALARPLAGRGYRVVVPDLPGHGRNVPRETDVPEWSRAVSQLARATGARALVAHSLGGAAATHAAVDLDLDALVLLAPAVRMRHILDTFRGMFDLPDAAVEGLRIDIEARFGEHIWSRWEVDRFPVPASTPVLLVHSRDDEQVAVSDGRLLAESLQNCEYVELAGLTHAKTLRDPGVLDLVTQFVEQHVRVPDGTGGL
jgi:pimeloyl-ACP methyl ester carboxylesterase